MANGNLYNKFRERGLSFSEAGLVENSLNGNTLDNVRIPKKKGHVFSYDDMLRMRGVIVPDSSKFKPTEKDRVAWNKSKPNVSLTSKGVEEYKSDLEFLIENSDSYEYLNMVGDMLAEAKDNDYDIDLFDYTFKASKKMREIYNKIGEYIRE